MTQTPTSPIQLPTVSDILAKTPAKYQPFVQALAPSVLNLASLGLVDVWAWLGRVVGGDQVGAYAQLITTVSDSAFKAQWDADDGLLDSHNADNNQRIQAFRTAAVQVLEAVAGAASLLVAI